MGCFRLSFSSVWSCLLRPVMSTPGAVRAVSSFSEPDSWRPYRVRPSRTIAQSGFSLWVEPLGPSLVCTVLLVPLLNVLVLTSFVATLSGAAGERYLVQFWKASPLSRPGRRRGYGYFLVRTDTGLTEGPGVPAAVVEGRALVARRRPTDRGGVVSGSVLHETRSRTISNGERGCRSPALCCPSSTSRGCPECRRGTCDPRPVSTPR